MAGSSKDKNANNGKGAAFGKRAKIDQAQKTMMIAICLSSVILGATAVGVVYLTKTIKFNAAIIEDKDKVIADYKQSQKNLEIVKTSIEELKTNEYLESIAGTRDAGRCSDYTNGNNASEENIELMRNCSSLRVISDTLPSGLNKEATLSSFNQLLLWSNNSNGVSIEGLSGDVNGTADMTGLSENIHPISVSISLSDSASRVNSALSVIESSIRNFDIASASLAWNSEDDAVELHASYNAYYSSPVEITTNKRKICSDDKNEVCIKEKAKITGSGGEE